MSAAALAVADELLGFCATRPRSGCADTVDTGAVETKDRSEAAVGGSGCVDAAGSDAGSGGVWLLVGGQRLEVPGGGVVLGRRPGPAGIVVSNPRVSRRHAFVQRTGTGIAVADLGSKSGTVVVRGGIRINAAQEGTPAVHGDRIMTATGLLLAEIVGEVSSDSSP